MTKDNQTKDIPSTHPRKIDPEDVPIKSLCPSEIINQEQAKLTPGVCNKKHKDSST